MSMEQPDLSTLPDLAEGIPSTSLPPGERLVGRVGEDPVLLIRTSHGLLHAVQAMCPHYGAPLVDGCVHEDRIHCPWHHASFELTDGAVQRPPALDPLKTWPVEEREGRVRVIATLPRTRTRRTPPRPRKAVVIVGAGAAGTAAAVTLREAGHRGRILLIDPDPAAPYDRPNLSKDYLAGTVPEEWLMVRPDNEWDRLNVERVVDHVARLEHDERVVVVSSGGRLAFDALILATGARPRRLAVPGGDRSDVLTLRSLADCRAIRARADAGARAVVVGAGFLGLEAAASLRTRNLDVHVVAPEAVPLGRVFGEDLGRELRARHEREGVHFHLRAQVEGIDDAGVRLADGTTIPADFTIAAVGVEPRLPLAKAAGLRIDGGVVVDTFLESSRARIFAAGDIAAFPHPRTGRLIRMEHWALAQAQGRTAALNTLGYQRPFRHVPFFWTTQYDITIQWSGFPDPWDSVRTHGSLAEGSVATRFRAGGVDVAAAFAGRDTTGLRWELARSDELEGHVP